MFVAADTFLSDQEELAHYQTHENHVSDVRYRRFLQPACDAVMAHIELPATGLDYGCGPGPALVRMLEEAGYSMSCYDPWFATDSTVLNQTYDFITTTEVAEHFKHPYDEFIRLWQMLKAGGLLVVMTRPVPREQDFGTWYYRLDPTHVAFYSDLTFDWIGHMLGATVLRSRPDVVMFRKTLGDERRPDAPAAVAES